MNFIKFRCHYQDDVWVNPEHVATVVHNPKHKCVEIRLSGDRLVLAMDFNDPEHVIHYLKTGYHYQMHSTRELNLPPGTIGGPQEPYGYVQGGTND